jgi:hypothetical protein
MDDRTPRDLTLQLPRDMYYQVIHTLRGSLPPPVTNSPEDEIRRDNAAIAKVASLLPANGEEAELATQFVAACASAHDSLRLAHQHGADTPTGMKCNAQAASMMRQARGARSLLLRVQAARQKREANRATCDQTAWIEHCAIGLMGDALGRFPPAPMAEPEPEPPASVQEAEPEFERLSEAEQYALIHPRRAALIRSLGGLPEKCDFGRPEPAVVRDIVTGTSPILRALDDFTEAAPAADEPRIQPKVRQEGKWRLARSVPADLIRWPIQKTYIAMYALLASSGLHPSRGPLTG